MVKVIKRPWGEMKRFVLNKKCSVKILTIKPKQMLSLQKHKKRDEMWYFLTPGQVQLGKRKIKVKKESVIKIKRNTAHRIIAGENKVIVLEISFGRFSEKDEVRLEDKYGRI